MREDADDSLELSSTMGTADERDDKSVRAEEGRVVVSRVFMKSFLQDLDHE